MATDPHPLLPAPTTWDEYLEGVIAWLSENWGPEKRCPYCGSPEWQIGPVREVHGADNWPTPDGEEPGFVPLVPVTSLQCGHVVLINALWIFESQESRRASDYRAALLAAAAQAAMAKK